MQRSIVGNVLSAHSEEWRLAAEKEMVELKWVRYCGWRAPGTHALGIACLLCEPLLEPQPPPRLGWLPHNARVLEAGTDREASHEAWPTSTKPRRLAFL
jgi:hypothetical protein